MAFFAELDAYAASRQGEPEAAPMIAALAKAKGELQEATLWLMQNGMANPENAGAASSDYLHLMGLTGLAYMWARMAAAAQARVAAGDADPFYARKLVVARHFFERVLPDSSAHLAKLKAGAQNLMALDAAAF